MIPKLKQQIQRTPQSPGVYIFKNKKGEFLYIGKAANLRNRLKQYSNGKALSPFMKNMAKEAGKIEIKNTDSEIEALILESQLIKKHQPKYNIMLRDGKQYFYVGFTVRQFPRIFLTHNPYKVSGKKSKTQITNFKSNSNVLKLKIENLNLLTLDTEYIGPFTDGNALKSTLRLLRKIFPYCTCKQKHNNFCLNYHIGKCLGYCCLKNAKITKQEAEKYKKNIRSVKNLLSGRKDTVIKKLSKELKKLGQEEKFEEAIELRNRIVKLEKVFKNARIISDANIQTQPDRQKALEEIKKMFKLSKAPERIEGYDISNIQGRNAVGSMVVFTGGRPDKNEYRKFKIIFKRSPDDIAMLKEILSRRLNHPEWPSPDLIFIDGGIAQLNVAVKTTGGKFPVISLAKGKQEIFSSTLKKTLPMEKLPGEIENLVRQIDSEAHRFAIAYHRKLHRRSALK